MPDVMERLAAYRPTAETIDAEWPATGRRHLLARVLSTPPSPNAGRLRFVPRHRVRLAVPLLSVAALTALMVGIVLVAVPSGHRSGQSPAGTPFVAGAVTATPQVGAGQYAYRVTETYNVAADGSATRTEREEDWVAPDGSVWSRRAAERDAQFLCFPHTGQGGFTTPTAALFASLPTDAAALRSYLRDHVSGSSTRDRAVFVAVGDMLRTADLLASSELRAALVDVLSRTGGVTVHTGVRDFLNRPAVRVDFVDQRIDPGTIESLYFDPATFQLIEERAGSTGAPGTYDGPSPAYDATAEQPSTSADLGGRSSVAVMTAEKVVDRLPADVAGCDTSGALPTASAGASLTPSPTAS